MLTVKKKPLTPNIIWDGSAGRPLCSFGHRGLLETNDPELAKKLAAMGHRVTGEADVPACQEETDNVGGNGLPQGDTDADPAEAHAVKTDIDAAGGVNTNQLADSGESAPEVETDADRQPEQTEERETASTPEKQAASPAAKGKRNRK